MRACIFAGPTLPPRDQARAQAGAWLPPAKHGDVYRAVMLLRPQAIGIVDGYFQWVPSVWHKEILWAMHSGVHVFGAASMGALRAAELAPYGMRGVGRIFEAYRSGLLADCEDAPFEDDDEVAVVHGPPETGYIAVSEAMVNIRCTLSSAVRAGVIAAATCAQLVAIAKAIYFPERSYHLVLERARAQALPEVELSALEAWLPQNRADQKRMDAVAMLAVMQKFLAQNPGPAQPNFVFEHTSLWELAVAGTRPATVHDAEETRALDELRLDRARWHALCREVLSALRTTAESDSTASSDALLQRLAELRGEPLETERLLEEAARNEALRHMHGQLPLPVIERQILTRIRDTGEFERWRTRAQDKLARIASCRDLPGIEDFSEFKLLELRDWYFSRVLGADMPDDIEQCVRDWGYADLMHFHRAIFEEFVYRRETAVAQKNATAAVEVRQVTQ